jgi:hypothetical protein
VWGLPELLGRRRSWLAATAWILSAIGWVAFAWFLVTVTRRDGGVAYDLRSYLLAAEHLMAGEPLYAPVGINDPDAYRYLPSFAIAWIPATILPEMAVTWAYRVGCVLCLRYLVGSWRAVGISFLFPPVAIELVALNVTLPLAAAARLALRGPRPGLGAALTPASAAIKWGGALLLPYLWLREPTLRRPIMAGSLGLAALLALHVALAPADWAAYLGSLAQQAASANGPGVGEQLIVVVPSVLADYLLRLAVAVALVVVAVWRGWGWLAFAAVTLAVPTLWAARLAALVAVPRLFAEESDWVARFLDREPVRPRRD